MKIILLLVFLSVSVALLFLAAFFWAVKDGQYEDEVTPSIRMLFDHPSSLPSQTNSDESNAE